VFFLVCPRFVVPPLRLLVLLFGRASGALEPAGRVFARTGGALEPAGRVFAFTGVFAFFLGAAAGGGATGFVPFAKVEDFAPILLFPCFFTRPFFDPSRFPWVVADVPATTLFPAFLF
jgi:hypothetical protein